MLIHVNDAVTLQGARALRQPLIIPYGIHQEYELQIVTGHDNAPVDVESRGCVKWTLTITPSPENPTKVLAYAVFAENIATGSYLRFDFAATSVEMYKHVAGNPATPAVLQLQGFTEEDAPATLVITLPVALVTTAQQRLPVDLSTALMQELQLAVSVVGAAQREISKYAGESTDAADRAEQAAINAHASEVNAQGSATAAGIAAGNARESELAAEGSAIAAAGSASDALVSSEAAHESELAAKASEDAAALSESNAHASEVAAKASEDAALASQNAAHDSEVAAQASEDAALASQNAAHASEQAAAQSASAAATHEGNAAASATAAAASAQAAAVSETNADASDTSAQLAAQAAEYARNGAVDAKVLAETAQSAAESAATDAADDTADAIEDQFRDDLSALSAAVNSAQSAATVATTSQQSASASAVSAQQSAAEAYEYAQQAGLNTVLILDAPPTTSTVAAVGQLAVWHDTVNDKNHLYHLVFISTSENATLYHWEECVLVSQGNVAGGYAGLGDDGQLVDGLIPRPTNTRVGGIKWSNSTVTGLYINSNGGINIEAANNAFVDTKSSLYKPIVPFYLDYAVRSVLPLVTEIPAATSDYSLVDSSATTLNHSHTFSHVPTQAPTYRLPSVSDTTVSHYIELTVDFTNVQTYSFLDANGDALVPLFTPSISAGDVYTFRMEYSAIKAKWLIYPQKQGAVADDFVMRGEVGAANGVARLNANGVVPSVQLPKASSGAYGTVMVYDGYGTIISNSYLAVAKASDNSIYNRSSSFMPIVPYNLNTAVKSALTDNNKISLTDAQKAAAQEVFGVHAPLIGTTAPTTSTVGVIGQLYVNTVTSKTYHCTAITNTGTESEPVWSYAWTDDINAMGGTFRGPIKKPNIYNANFVWDDSVAIGVNANAGRLGSGSVSICGGYTNGHYYNVAIGQGTHANINSQVAIGNNYQSDTTHLLTLGVSKQQVAIGTDYTLFTDGISQVVTVIPAATTAYTLAEGMQSHTPEAASVYTLPAVTDATRTHECIITIKFSSSVLTYEFQDSADNTLVPLPLNGDIEAGSVVTFLCRYNPLLAQWVIYPVMDGKEVTP